MSTRAVLLAVLAVLALAGPARAAEVTSWSQYGDEHDFITLGVSRVLHPGNAQTLRATLDQWGDYGAFGRPLGGGDGIYLTYVQPEGQPLRPYNHVGVQRMPFHDAGHAGLQLEGGTRSCNSIDGRYELRQLALGPDGRPTRLWLLYEAFCDSPDHASFGEIRVNAVVPDAQRSVAPGIVRWPVIDAWQTSTEVPVSYLGTAPVASVAVVGAHAGDFALDPSGCAASNGPCDVRVRFAPTTGGARTAVLRFTDTSGHVHESTLEGYAHPGTSAAEVELVAEGRTVHYTPANTLRFGATGYDVEVEFALRDTNEFVLGGVFGSASRPLAPGHFPDAGADWPSPKPWLRFLWTNQRCEEPGGGEFTLHEFRRMPDETLRSFDVGFVARCQDDGQVIARGRWRFRAGAGEALPEWLVPGPRDPAPPDEPPPADPGDPPPPDDPADPPPPDDPDDPADPPPAQPSVPPMPAAPAPATPAAPRRAIRLTPRWRVGRSATRLLRLDVRGAASVKLRCRGASCPFRSRTVAVRRGRAALGQRLIRTRLRPGTVLELRVGDTLARYVIRRGASPRNLTPG